MRLAGKIALVTGAASGIGKAVVAAFAREGAEVVAADIHYQSGAVSLYGGTTQAFTATVVASNPAITWAILEGNAGGTIIPTSASSAQYTAPATPGTYHLAVTSVADPSKSARATITVLAFPAIGSLVVYSPWPPVFCYRQLPVVGTGLRQQLRSAS